MSKTGIPLDKYYLPPYSIPESSRFEAKVSNFYHYTDVGSGIEIIKEVGNSIELWPSQLLYLNDESEYQEGMKFIKDTFHQYNKTVKTGKHLSHDVIEKFNEILHSENLIQNEVYIMCFSSNNDVLSQWKYYGKGCGLAIEFNLDPNEVYYTGLETTDTIDRNRYPVGPYRVIYKAKDKRKIINKTIEEVIHNYENLNDQDAKERHILIGLQTLISYCPLFKNRSFKEEKEYRLIFRPCYLKDETKEIPELIHYRVVDGRIKPHMKIRLNRHIDKENVNLIKSIKVGPGSEQDLVVRALKHLVDRRPDIFKDQIKIERSQIPFRG